MTDTIYAASSGRPPAAIAIIRISGPDALAAGMRLAGTLPPPRIAGLRALRATSGGLLDRALVLVFPGPRSATGEDLLELHCHGGRAIVAAIEATLAAHGLRHADPGEFTRRALVNGRIDLAQAEGLADLLEAETETQRLAALDATEGRVSGMIRGWVDRIGTLSASIEAALDFADTDDVADDPEHVHRIVAAMAALADEIDAVLDAPSVERLRDGTRVVIAGPPNAGKSTLLNLLAERDAAIVADIAGTTRDRIEAPVMRDGHSYLLVDTAGITATIDPVEAIGVDRARRAAEAAELLVWVSDDPPPRSDALWLQAQSDRPGRDRLLPGRALMVRQDDAASIEVLWQEIARRAGHVALRDHSPVLRERQRRSCAAAASELRGVNDIADALIVAEHLRVASRDLGLILGVEHVDAMLDQLFSRFCIGK